MMDFRALLAGCWLDHDLIRERRGKHLTLVCQRCGWSKAILKNQKFKARKHPKLLKFGKRKTA